MNGLIDHLINRLYECNTAFVTSAVVKNRYKQRNITKEASQEPSEEFTIELGSKESIEANKDQNREFEDKVNSLISKSLLSWKHAWEVEGTKKTPVLIELRQLEGRRYMISLKE